MASRRLDDLSARFRPFAVELLARLVEAQIPVLVIETRRTFAEHQANLAKGVSWTPHSKHLDGDAIDLCPYEQFQLHGPDKLQWATDDPVWPQIGAIGEALGLRWGGRWQQKDMGHFEFVDHTGTPAKA
jgi:hypothetical protein